jgi:hypothetical protein
MKLVFTLVLFSAYFYATAQNCIPGEAYIELNVNNINAGLRNSGDLWWDGVDERYVTPADGIDEVSAIFAGGLWIGGLGPNNSLKLAAVQYRTGNNGDYYPGPLKDIDGQAFENGCIEWDRFWVVNKSEIDTHFIDFNDGSIDNQIDNIYSWPGRNNPHFESFVGFPLPKNQKLAPFFDNDQDGNYNPDNGDYPLIKGDQSIWWVFNDNAGFHGLTNATAIQIEVHAMAYAFANGNNEHLNNATFYDFELINKASDGLRDAYVGLWVDFNLGCSEDDYSGYDEEYQMMYVYNSDAVDGFLDDSCPGDVNTYGDNIPMVGIKKMDGNIYPVTSHTVMNRGKSNPPIGDPNNNGVKFYNYLRGSWGDGTAMTYGGSGFDPASIDTVKFAFNGDPSDEAAWSMCTADLPLDDRRTFMSSAMPDLQPRQSTTASYAVIYVDNISYPCPNLDRLKEAADAVCDAVLSSDDDLVSNIDFKVSPNPASNQIKITSPNPIASVKVIDINGQIVLSENSKKSKIKTLDISSLPGGIYFISIKDDQGNVAIEKIIKN